MAVAEKVIKLGMVAMVVLASAGSARAAVVDYLIEARSPGVHSSQYSETGTGWSNSGVHNTFSGSVNGFPAPTLTAGIGERFNLTTGVGTPSAIFSFTPVETGDYEVYAGWGTSTNQDTDVLYTMHYDSGGGTNDLTADQHYNQGQNCSGLSNVWVRHGAGTYHLTAGVTYQLVVTNPAANNCSDHRAAADTVFFRNTNAVCSGVATVSVRTPVLTGDTSVTVTGVDPSATSVSVYANGLLVGTNGSPTPPTVTVTTSALPASAHINATQTIGGVAGCVFQDGPITNDCNQIGPVSIGGVLKSGDTSVPVSGVDPQATAVKVYENSVLIGTNSSPGGASTVNVTTSALTSGATVAAIQEVRGLAPCTVPPTGGVVVDNCNQVSAVSVVGMVDAGRVAVRVFGVTASATVVTVYANDVSIATNNAPTAGTTVVTVPALIEGQTIKATQTIRLEGCLPTCGRRVMAAGIIEDFQDLTTNASDCNFPKIPSLGDPPTGAPVNRVWYNAGLTGNFVTTESITTMTGSGSKCIEFHDNGGSNGMYAVYEQIIPTTGTYHIQVEMAVDEAAATDTTWFNQFQVGVQTNSNSVTLHRANPAVTIPACSIKGDYTGPLTPGVDDPPSPVIVYSGDIIANAGDSMLIAFSTNVSTYVGQATNVSPTTNGMKIDNIQLNTGPKPCLPSDVASVTISKGPLEDGGNQVIVSGINPTSTAVTVYELTPPSTYVQIGTANPGGSPEATVTVSPVLVAGKTIVATQTNVVPPCPSQEGAKPTIGPVVGTGTNTQIRLALGIRETGGSGPIGADSGSITGPIEWIIPNDPGDPGDGQVTGGIPRGKLITPGPNWQTITFSSSRSGGTDPVFAALGTVGSNGALDGAWGTLEHLAFTSTGTNTGRYIVYIDNVANGATTFADFETGTTLGAVALFRTPNQSGTTSPNLLNPPAVSAVDGTRADTGSRSLRVEFQFKDNLSSRWLRLTTVDDALTTNMPYQNPMVDLDQPISVRLLMFACDAPFADTDNDGDSDLEDFAVFQLHYKQTPLQLSGLCFDRDGDGDVDELDFDAFEACASRSTVPTHCTE